MAGEQVKILVVDDEEGVRNLLQRMLEGAGYEVVSTGDGEEALYWVSRGDINVALLDIKMPTISGIELLNKITADYPDVCVIMATAVIDIQTAIDSLKLGALDYITKPFKKDAMLQKVREAISRWERQLKEKNQQLLIQEKFADQTEKMQEQFGELVNSLSREHAIIFKLAANQGKSGEEMLKKLPPELREPIDSIDGFRDALLRILKRT
ncbi:MAG: response regulator [Thermoplasmata archaeon]